MEPDHSAAYNTKSDRSMVFCCQKIICDNLSKLGEYLAQINLKKKMFHGSFKKKKKKNEPYRKQMFLTYVRLFKQNHMNVQTRWSISLKERAPHLPNSFFFGEGL